MKKNQFFSLRFIAAFVGMIALLAIVASFTPKIAEAGLKMGNWEDCTLQVCPEIPPSTITMVIGYKNGQKQTVTTSGPTVQSCPPGEFLGGKIVPGIEDGGEVDNVTVAGVTARRGGPAVLTTIGGVRVTIQITIYSGHVYIRIRIRL